MERHFNSNPQVEACLNQIIEKLFTVCLITGTDSEEEYRSGCQIVSNATHLLQKNPEIPSESLEDAFRQLLEQQLPDSQVINNFPSFQEIMHKMLHEGMTKEIDSNTTSHLGEAEVTLPAHIDQIDDELCEPDELLEPVERLKYVLRNIFPNVPICWNRDLMGLTFLAQVEDILIYLDNPEHSCPVEDLIEKGWKVYVCSSEALMFPRRLEREIRQLRRLRKL